MEKRFLFINNSDLADTDSNGRTLRDVFSFVDDKNLFSFCVNRKNQKLAPSNTFFIDESKIFKPKIFLKTIHTNPKSVDSKIDENKNRKTKKNPLTCLLRNAVWNCAFILFRSKLKKWIFEIKPDYIIFDPSDFLFMHKIARYISKKANKKLILYNTEDYYFKSWNYLHKENGFSFLYPLFRHKLKKNFKKTFKKSYVCFHNVSGLLELFKNEFPKVKQYLIYHPSNIVSSIESFESSNYKDFYYCGGLDKGRDKTFVALARSIKRISPSSKIYFNGNLNKTFNNDFIEEIGNVANLGFCTYQEVEERLKEPRILISVASLNDYDAKDKYHVFSTKLSDYIASFNPILHIGPVGEEYNTLKEKNLAFVCKKEEEIDAVVKEVFDYLQSFSTSKFESQKAFFDTFLNPSRTAQTIIDILKAE